MPAGQVMVPALEEIVSGSGEPSARISNGAETTGGRSGIDAPIVYPAPGVSIEQPVKSAMPATAIFERPASQASDAPVGFDPRARVTVVVLEGPTDTVPPSASTILIAGWPVRGAPATAPVGGYANARPAAGAMGTAPRSRRPQP